MKKLITILIVGFLSLVFAGSGANTYVAGGNAHWGRPSNVSVYALDSATQTYLNGDTIGATYINYYGPFALSVDPSRTQYKYLRCLTPSGTLGATETLSVEYQVISGKTWADTAKSGWTSFDSIKAATGSAGTVVDISDEPGVAICFKMHCLSNSSTAIIAHPVKVILVESASAVVDIKH